MKHTLVKPDGGLGASHDFPGAPPVLSANKGRWLPDTAPAYDPATHTIAVTTPVPVNATVIPYTTTQRPVADVRAEKLAALAALRYQSEIAGVNVGGSMIATDRESQSALNGAYTSMRDGLMASTPWKAENGWVEVNLAQITPVATAVAMHVRGCFANEKAHSDAITALGDDVALIAAHNISTGWPQ